MTSVELDLLRLAGAGFVAAAIAVAGWLYSRRIGVAAAEKTLNEANKSLIETLQAQLAASERHCDERIAHLERQVEAWEKRWQRWAGGPIG